MPRPRPTAKPLPRPALGPVLSKPPPVLEGAPGAPGPVQQQGMCNDVHVKGMCSLACMACSVVIININMQKARAAVNGLQW
mmetsp:Transcript_14464/g.35927  ORF Transcript_14464/g.35927 Transcript_14464/m.35927 type:complete len:81 (-) Transcript_14464:769-1011(-)